MRMVSIDNINLAADIVTRIHRDQNTAKANIKNFSDDTYQRAINSADRGIAELERMVL